jgi:hypothetical protein
LGPARSNRGRLPYMYTGGSLFMLRRHATVVPQAQVNREFYLWHISKDFSIRDSTFGMQMYAVSQNYHCDGRLD